MRQLRRALRPGADRLGVASEGGSNRSQRWDLPREALGERASLDQALAYQEPGRLAVGQEVVGLVEELEGGPRGSSR